MKDMKRLLGALLAICLLLGCASFAFAADAEDVPLLGETAAANGNGFIVKLREPENKMRLFSADPALQPIAYSGSYYTVQTVEELRPYLDAGLVESLSANLKMELLDDDTEELTNDPEVGDQWYLESIHAQDLWSAGYDGSGVKIAVIDSGVRDTHEDLAGASIEGRNFCGEIVDDVQLYTEMYQDTNGNGHGTVVTGILAARRNNGIGVAGLLDNVKILSLRCLSPNNTEPQNKKGGYVDTVISAVGYAMEHGADVINMSLVIKQDVPALKSKLQEASDAGIILVAPAGNYGTSDPDAAIYPACYDFVVSVGATRSDNLIMASSQKNDQLTVAAPGNVIRNIGNASDAAYTTLSGTSMASPIVAALAAAVKQKNQKIDVNGFMKLLEKSAIDQGAPGRDDSYGYGIVDAGRLCSAFDDPYTITYQANGGTMPTEAYITDYQMLQDEGTPLPTPTRGVHDSFAGWYLDEALTKGPYTTFPEGCAGDVTLWAAWKALPLEGVTVKLTGIPGVEDVTAAQDENADWKALLPDGTTKAFISTLTSANISVTGAEVSSITRATDDGTKWTFTVEGTPYVLHVPAPRPLRITESWEGTATPASLDGITAAVPCEMPVGDWFRGEIISIKKGAGSFPANFGTLSVTGDLKTMIFTPSAEAAGQTLTATVFAQNGEGLSVATTVTIRVNPIPGAVPTPTDPEATFAYGEDDLPVQMTLCGYQTTGVRLNGEPLGGDAYSVSADTVLLKAAWLNTLTEGDHTLTVYYSSNTSAGLTLRIRSIPRPSVVSGCETQTAAAAPASQDGIDSAVPYVAEDVSEWFSGTEITGYSFSAPDAAGTIAMAGTKLTYTPVAADAGKNLSIRVYASNETGKSNAVTVNVAVGAEPLSDPTLISSSLSFSTKATDDLTVQFRRNGAAFQSLTCDDAAVDAENYTLSTDNNTLTLKNTWLKKLDIKNHTLAFAFTNCRTESLKLTLTLTVTSGATMESVIAGIAEAAALNPSMTIPEANTAILYTAAGSKATISVQDEEAAKLALCGEITLAFPAEIYAAQLSEKTYRAPKNGTTLKFSAGSFFVRSTAPASGDRTFSISSPTANTWYLSFTGDPVGTTVLLPCAAGKWKATLRTAQGERTLPSVYDTKENCLRVALPESGTLMISPIAEANPFKDVATGAWYYDAVQNAYHTELMQGVSADSYAPGTPVSRAMLVTILWRLSGKKTDASGAFKDVPADAWHASAAAWAQQQGLVNGYPDGSFRPDAPVSRQELMTILWRFAEKQGAAQGNGGKSSAAFSDAGVIADYAASAVSGMIANGIVNGVGTNPARLAPTEGATRAQLAVILQRFLEHLSDKQ